MVLNSLISSFRVQILGTSGILAHFRHSLCLYSKIGGLDLRVIHQFLSRPEKDEDSILDHIAPVNDGQKGPCKLFRNQDRHALPSNPLDCPGQIFLKQGRKTKEGFIHQKEAWPGH